MAAMNPLDQLKNAKERAAKLKGVKKHAEEGSKLLAQLAKAQTAGKKAKEELETESEED